MHLGTHAAYAPAQQANGSSGGIVSWILVRLLERKLIDFALHVAPASAENGRFFGFRVSATASAVEEGSTSFYYPVSMDEVLAIVKARPGRYAITGVPCFHKALRRLRAQDPVIDSRIHYQIGIVCGQMKSKYYLDYLVRMAGAPAGNLVEACFRRKVPGHPANDYAFEATLERPDGAREVVRVMNSKIGVNWGMGYFKPRACEVCDDVFAETADMAVMDAWLPEFVKDGQGWSLVVTRTGAIEAMLKSAIVDADVVAQPVTVHQVAESQRGGLNHRRKALPYRLWLQRKAWVPNKRFPPSAKLKFILRIEQRLREVLRVRSRTVWMRTGDAGDLGAFQKAMKWHVLLFRLFGRIKQLGA